MKYIETKKYKTKFRLMDKGGFHNKKIFRRIKRTGYHRFNYATPGIFPKNTYKQLIDIFSHEWKGSIDFESDSKTLMDLFPETNISKYTCCCGSILNFIGDHVSLSGLSECPHARGDHEKYEVCKDIIS